MSARVLLVVLGKFNWNVISFLSLNVLVITLASYLHIIFDEWWNFKVLKQNLFLLLHPLKTFTYLVTLSNTSDIKCVSMGFDLYTVRQ